MGACGGTTVCPSARVWKLGARVVGECNQRNHVRGYWGVYCNANRVSYLTSDLNPPEFPFHFRFSILDRQNATRYCDRLTGSIESACVMERCGCRPCVVPAAGADAPKAVEVRSNGDRLMLHWVQLGWLGATILRGANAHEAPSPCNARDTTATGRCWLIQCDDGDHAIIEVRPPSSPPRCITRTEGSLTPA